MAIANTDVNSIYKKMLGGGAIGQTIGNKYGAAAVNPAYGPIGANGTLSTGLNSNPDAYTPDYMDWKKQLALAAQQQAAQGAAGGAGGVATGASQGAAQQQAATGAGTTGGSAAGATGGGATGGFYSPELEGLKHSYLGQDWLGQSAQSQKMGGYMDQLANPLTMQVGLSDQERQAIYNQGRQQIQGGTHAAMGEMQDRMASTQGFRPGESGKADAALAQIANQGQQQLGNYAGQIATQEAQNRFAQNMQLQELNLNRMLGAGKFGEAISGMDLAKQGLGLQAGQFGAGMEQFQQQLAAQQAAAGAASGSAADQLAWQKEKWGQEFQYGKESDAMNMLMQMYGLYGNQQQAAWNPYYSAMAK